MLLAGVPASALRRDHVETTPTWPSDRPPLVTVAELEGLVAWAREERLIGLLWAALQAKELVIAPDVDRERSDRLSSMVQEAVLSGLRSALAAEATGVAALEVLRSGGIEACMFKGIATAHLDYDDPAERVFYDADLLVARRDLGSAVAVLGDAGFRRVSIAMRPSWERRFARAVELRYERGVELDLHAAIATGYFGQVLDHDLMRTDLAAVHLGGGEYSAFGPTGRLVVSCYAIVLSRGPRLRLYADLARQLLVSGADWQLAARWAADGDSVIAEALRRLGVLLDIDHDAIDWAGTVVPSTTARRALDYAVRAERDGWSADARSALLALAPIDRARFMTGIAEHRLRRRRR